MWLTNKQYLCAIKNKNMNTEYLFNPKYDKTALKGWGKETRRKRNWKRVKSSCGERNSFIHHILCINYII